MLCHRSAHISMFFQARLEAVCIEVQHTPSGGGGGGALGLLQRVLWEREAKSPPPKKKIKSQITTVVASVGGERGGCSKEMVVGGMNPGSILYNGFPASALDEMKDFPLSSNLCRLSTHVPSVVMRSRRRPTIVPKQLPRRRWVGQGRFLGLGVFQTWLSHRESKGAPGFGATVPDVAITAILQH